MLSAGAATERCCQVVPAHGHHSQMPRPFDGRSQPTLVFGTHSRLAPRFNLGLVRKVPSQHIDVFVVNILGVVHTECTNLPSCIIARSPPAANPSATTTGSSSRATASGSCWSALCRHSVSLSRACLPTKEGLRHPHRRSLPPERRCQGHCPDHPILLPRLGLPRSAPHGPRTLRRSRKSRYLPLGHHHGLCTANL